MALKKCKECGSEISATANVCPKCGYKQTTISESINIIIKCIGAIIPIVVIFYCVNSFSSCVKSLDSLQKSEQEEKIREQKMFEGFVNLPNSEYIDVTVDEMMRELEENSARAQAKYKGQFVKITGSLHAIDSDLEYISLLPCQGIFNFRGVQCTFTNYEQKEAILGKNTGDIICIKGKITDVGELMAYRLKIISVE